jgi:hypothetical protein
MNNAFQTGVRGRILSHSRLFVLLLGLSAVGCGLNSKGNISGKVLYDGKPLPGGLVTFVPTSGQGAFTSRLGPDGSYSLEKVPTGPMKIAVKAFPPKQGGGRSGGGRSGGGRLKPMADKVKSGKITLSDETRAKMSKGMKEQLEAAAGPKEADVSVPPQYSDPEKSGLQYTVTSGSQTHDVEIPK